MPKASCSIEINAPGCVVFDLIHNYSRRLEWDSMLSSAKLLGGATAAEVGVRSLCTGTWRSGFLALETEYIRFEPGRIAAVRLTNNPKFFSRFAATIRHDSIGPNACRTTYIYSFQSRPRCLAFLLEPIMNAALTREVQRRLQALKAFIEADPRYADRRSTEDRGWKPPGSRHSVQ